MAQPSAAAGKFVAAVPDPAGSSQQHHQPAQPPTAGRDEVGELEAQLQALQQQRAALQAEKDERVAAHVARMDELARARGDAVAHTEERLAGLVGGLQQRPADHRRLSKSVRSLQSRHRSLQAARRELHKALMESETRAARSSEKLQTVLAELQKLKVAVSVKQVHNAALELRHAKRVMELQSVLKQDRDEARKEFDARIEEGGKLLAEETARKYKPVLRAIQRESQISIRKMEHDANVAAKKKAKQLAHKAAKRFESVVWPALLQLEVSTRAQQHVAMALTSEFEARQAALGDPPSPPPAARATSASYLHGAPAPHGVDTGPVRAGHTDVSHATWAAGAGGGSGVGGGANARGGRPNGGAASVASGTTYSAAESYRDEATASVGEWEASGDAPDAREAAELKTRVFNMYMKPAHGGPPDLLRVVQFLKEAQQCVGFSTVLDDMYRTERARLLAQMK